MKAFAFLMGRLLSLGMLSGYRTYIAAAGLFGLGIYQISIGEIDLGIQTLLSACAAAGVRKAVANLDVAKPLAILFLLIGSLTIASANPPESDRVFKLPPEELLPVGLSLALEQIPDWGYDALKLADAHKFTKGKNVRVAILDTGIDLNHVEFKGRIVASKDFSGSRNGVSDVQGHGTHCAGIVAAADNGIGVIGVAPEADLLIGKVLGDNGSGLSTWIAAGVDWAVENKAKVISMSLGSSEPDSRIRGAIQRAVAAGVIVVAAAGNEGPSEGTVGFPGGFPEAICVASINRSLKVSQFSSRGTRVDIAAPGEAVRSTFPGDRYATLSGTSMATPQIAGVAALAVAHAMASGKELTPSGFRELLSKSASDLPPPGRDSASGAGLVRPVELLALIATVVAPPPPTAPILIEFGLSDLTPSGLDKLRQLNPRLERITFVLKP